MKNILFLFSFLVLTTPIKSQDLDTITLEKIVLYGSFLELDELNTGKNVTVIKASDIKQKNFNSLDELLQTIPSIELQSRGGFGNQSDLILRGTTFNQTLVLLDGIRVNDPLTGHFSMYIPITIYDIEQIEIIRGSSSSIYGPDAVGGIINVVTKTFTDKKQKDKMSYSGKLGQNNFFSGQAFLGVNFNKKIYSSISTGLIKSDGQELQNGGFSFFDNRSLSISSKYDINDKLSWYMRVSLDKRFFNSQYYYTRSSYDKSNELVSKQWYQTKLKYVLRKGTLFLNHSFQETEDKYVFNPLFPSYENKTKLNNGRLNYVLSKIDLTAGFDYQNRKIESVDRGNHNDNYYGAFVVYNKNIKRFIVNPSLRIDYNSSYSFQLSPQFNISYHHNNIILRTAMGKSIRSADFTERFYNNNYSGMLSEGRNIGNPDLNAESSLNFEFGFDFRKENKLHFKNTIFYRHSTNLIDWVLTENYNIPIDIEMVDGYYELVQDENGNVVDSNWTSNYFFAQNISELYTLGFESEAWFLILDKNKTKINGSLGYTKILTGINKDDLFSSENRLFSKYLANNSGDKFNYSLMLDFPTISFFLNGYWKKRDFDEDLMINHVINESYFVNNVKAKFSVNSNANFTFEVLNFLNVDYADILGASMPKRWFIIGTEINL